MYDASIGKWLSRDPKKVGWSPYIGIGNNPINKIDPDGGSPQDDIHIKTDKPNELHVVEANAPDRYFIDGILINYGSGTPDGSWNTKDYIGGRTVIRYASPHEYVWGSYNSSTPSATDLALAGVGTSFYVGERQSSHILSSRSGYSSGKLNINSAKIYSKTQAKGISTMSKSIGWGLTAWSIYDTETQYRTNPQFNRRAYNHINNGVSVYFPITAIPIAIGDYAGQQYANEINSLSEPGGFLFETMRWTMDGLGVPTGIENK